MIERIPGDMTLLWGVLWQTTLCLGAGLLLSRIYRRHAGRAHFLLVLSLGAAVILPAGAYLVRVYGLGLFEPAQLPGGGDRETMFSGIGYAVPVLLAVWLALSGLLLVRLLICLGAGLNLLRRARPLVRESVHGQLESAASRLGEQSTPVLFATTEVNCPAIWCWGLHPALLVPTRFADDATVSWPAVFLHELAHLKRRDHMATLFAELASCLLFWHPLLWAVRRRMFQVSDEACDAWAVSSGESPESYAETLLAMIPQQRSLSALSIVSGKKSLAARLESLLQHPVEKPSVGSAWGTCTTAGMLVLVAAVALAQPAAPQPDPAAGGLVANASMEQGDGSPAGWEKGNSVPGVEYTWDRATAHSGSSSLKLSKSERRFFPVAEWKQKLAAPVPGDAHTLEVSAWVRARDVTKAILDVQFVDAGGKWSHEWASYIGAKQASDPAVTHDWKLYQGSVKIPPGAKEVTVGLQIYGPGTLWWDDVTAHFPSSGSGQAAGGSAGAPADPKAAAAELTRSGWQHFMGRKPAEAEADFQKAVTLDPSLMAAWNGLGWALKQQGKNEPAKAALTKVLAVEPAAAGALTGLGDIAKAEGNTEQAIAYWQKAVAASPGDSSAIDSLITTFTELKNYDKAIEYAHQWLKHVPDSSRAREQLKWAEELARR